MSTNDTPNTLAGDAAQPVKTVERSAEDLKKTNPTTPKMRVDDGAYPHVKWIDLKMNGMMVECVVIRKDNQGNLHYIELGQLDAIDKDRIARILGNRNVNNFPLWDLMSQTTLNNGVNALDYFHQLVKVVTVSGEIYTPRAGVIGTGKVQL